MAEKEVLSGIIKEVFLINGEVGHIRAPTPQRQTFVNTEESPGVSLQKYRKLPLETKNKEPRQDSEGAHAEISMPKIQSS